MNYLQPNYVGLFVNVARAWEIARTGGFVMCIVPGVEKDDPEYQRRLSDIKTICSFYENNITQSITAATIVVSLDSLAPEEIINSYVDGHKYESLQDIIDRTEEYKRKKNITILNGNKEIEIKLKGSVLTLLKSAINKLSLSLRQVDNILRISMIIALMADKTEVMPEHIAEAIQYNSIPIIKTE